MDVDFPHKIVPPQRPAYLVPRPRLTELLASTVADVQVLTLTAPAGYGKTSLLTDLASTPLALPVCWYTLDRFDADPWAFVGYLVAAIQQQFPQALAQTVTLLENQGPTSFEKIVVTLVREVYAIGRAFVLILDDWHLVDSVADISESVTHLLTRCPNCHLILASRTYPSLPDLMLLSARRQLRGIDEEPLRFTPDEATAVLGAAYPAVPAPRQVAALTRQTNGWITGILLAVQASDANAPPAMPLGARGERQVYRFLGEQVFDRQPAALQEFLLDTALLEDMNAARCDQLFERDDAGTLLEQLLMQRLFVSEVKPGVLRYHPLFREFLLSKYQQTNPQRYRAQALRLAAAYAGQAQWAQAFEIYVGVGDVAQAQGVVAAGGEQLYTGGRLETLERWFEALPLETLDAHLLCLKARVLLNRGKPREAQVLVDLAEVRQRPDERQEVLLLRAYLLFLEARCTDALALAEEALASAADEGQRAAALRMLARCHNQLKQTAAAGDELLEALQIERQRGNLYEQAVILIELGLSYEARGLLGRAEACYSDAEACWAALGNNGPRAMCLNNKGVVQHLSGQHRAAFATLSAALECARAVAIRDYEATALTSLGDLYSDLQLWPQANQSYEQAQHSGGGSAYLRDYLALAGVQLLLRQRHYAAALRALERLPAATLGRYGPATTLLRASIACGLGAYGQAGELASQAAAAFEQGGERLELARAHLIQAQVALYTAPTDPQALTVPLDQAAALSDQLGHDAFLIAETLHMPALLRHASAIGWPRAEAWLDRQRELRHTAQTLAQDDTRPLLVALTLGADRVLLDGQVVEIGWLKAREVFYYLLAHPEGATPDALCEAIWPDLGAKDSRDALRSAVYRLRSQLPRELIVLRQRQIYALDPAVARIEYDAAQFASLLDPQANTIDMLFSALDLYRGPYLPLIESSWCSALRSHLERQYLQVLHRTATHCQHEHLYSEALSLFQRVLALDALDEAAHAGVMRAQFALGNRAAAIDQYHLARRLLNEELGLDLGASSEVSRIYSSILSEA